MESFVKTPLTSVNAMFGTDQVIVIPHNGTYSDNGRKPPFSVILCPLGGQTFVSVAQRRINSEHSSNKRTHQ